jgi:hypothetical protein
MLAYSPGQQLQIFASNSAQIKTKNSPAHIILQDFRVFKAFPKMLSFELAKYMNILSVL